MGSEFTIAQVAWAGAHSSTASPLLVVALHGRGSDERSMVGVADHLPSGVTMAALRAPIAEGAGFAWFANRGIGRPIEESIKATGAAVMTWLDHEAQRYDSVVLLGFSGGTAMAGGLLLAEPTRFSGAVLLSGTLPWDCGYDTSPGRLSGVPVLWGNDLDDPVIPAELVVRSQAWLAHESGALLTERHYPGMGHSIEADELGDIQEFINSLV